MNPFFSIIIPTYNRAHMLPKAINSIINQTYPDWELIVVDDESTDNTKETVETFNDSRIKYLFKKNNERSAARNAGIEIAKGKYICFLDDDDYYLNNHLEEFYKCIERNSFPKAVLYCNTFEDIDGTLSEIPNDNVIANNNIELILLKVIGCPRTCVHVDIFLNYKFNENINVGEDTELWSRILKEYPLIYNNVSTVAYLNHNNRTVALENRYAFTAHIKMIKGIIKEDEKHFISGKVRKEILSIAYFNLARHYEFKKKKLKLILTMLHSIGVNPKQRLKEKIYIILNNMTFTRIIISILKLRN